MNLRPVHKEDLSVNLTPLIDVVFLLLIFFMVSTTFKKESEIQVNLPEAETRATQKQEESVDITIDSQANFYVNQQRLVNTKPETLKRAIRIVIGEGTGRMVLISADAMAPHQAVVTAMDAARQLGITRITLATQSSSDSQ